MKSVGNCRTLIGLFLLSQLPMGLLSCRRTTLTPATEFTSPVITCQTEESGVGICGYDYANKADSLLAIDGWTRAFADEFDQNPAHSANHNWNVWVGGAFNNELQMYTDRPQNLTITQDPSHPHNNVLLIRSVKEDVTGPRYRQDVDETSKNFSFTSARIESNSRFTVNSTTSQVRMVARLRLPRGYGMWSAFWTYGENWPTNGGILPLQARGNRPYEFQTAYFYDNNTAQKATPREENSISTTTSLTDRWHVYEVIWSRDRLTFLLDGQVIDNKNGSSIQNLVGRLHRITINLAVGGDFFSDNGTPPTPDQILLNESEGILLVDWVKVYLKR